MKEPKRVETLELCLHCLKTKLHLDDVLSEAANLLKTFSAPRSSGLCIEEYAAKIPDLHNLLQVWVSDKYSKLMSGNDQHNPWHPSNLTEKKRGLYCGWNEIVPDKHKYGTSNRPLARAKKDQPVYRMFASLMTYHDLESFVSADLVSSIKALGLPGLYFHQGRQDELDVLVRMQVTEIFFACAYHCFTETVGERLVQLPSHDVVMACSTSDVKVALSEPKHANARSFFDKVGKAHFVGTWPTLKSRLYEMKADCAFLRAKLSRELPDDEFLTKLLFKQLTGLLLYGSSENVIKFSPREKDIERVIQQIHEELPEPLDNDAHGNDQQDIMNRYHAHLRDSLQLLRGTNYTHYVRPSDAELDKGARQVLDHFFQHVPIDDLIVIERSTINKIEKESPEWFETHFDLSQGIHVAADRRFVLVRTKNSGHRVAIVLSFFKMMGQQAAQVTRFRAVKVYLQFSTLLCASNHIDQQELEDRCNLYCSFLMKLEGTRKKNVDDDDECVILGDDDDEDVYDSPDNDDEEEEDGDDKESETVDEGPSCHQQDEWLDGGYRAARLQVCPPGYFLPATKGVRFISQKLGIGYCETLYLRSKLSQELFNQVLLAHGIQVQQEQEDQSPLEVGYECPGLPATPNYPAKPCGKHDDTYLGCVGAHTRDHVFGGYICCRGCQNDIQVRELDVLEHRAAATTTDGVVPPLTQHQHARMEFLRNAKKRQSMQQTAKDKAKRQKIRQDRAARGLPKRDYVAKGRSSHHESQTEEKMNELRALWATHDKTKNQYLHVPTKDKNGKKINLGTWLSRQRSTRGEKLTPDQKLELETMVGPLEIKRNRKNER